MDKLSQASEAASNVYDFAALDKLRSSAADDKAALRAAATQFESIFTKMLLTSMRKASEVLESDSPFNSESSKFYRDMHDQQMVSNIADTGGLGLADMVMEQLAGTNPKFRPASVLRGDGQLVGGDRSSGAGLSLAEQGEQGIKLPTEAQQSLPWAHEKNRVKNIHPQSVMQIRGTKAQDAAVQSPADHAAAQKAVQNTEQSAEQKSSLFSDPKSFVQAVLPYARKVVAGKGLEPLMLVAQAALETGWGQKVINKKDGSSSFNLFGIKANQQWQGDKANVQTLEYKDGVAKKENATFRAYDSVEESIRDYIDFLSSSERYQNALQKGTDPKQYFNELQSAGYATDPNYGKKILSILNSDLFNQSVD